MPRMINMKVGMLVAGMLAALGILLFSSQRHDAAPRSFAEWRALTEKGSLAPPLESASLVLLRNDSGAVPMDSRLRLLVVATGPSSADASADAFTSELRRFASGTEVSLVLLLDGTPSGAEADLLNAASRADGIIVADFHEKVDSTGNTLAPDTRSALEALVTRERPTALVTFGTPEMAGAFGGAGAVLVSLGSSPSDLRSAAAALVGKAEVRGRLPFDIGSQFRVGAGVDLEQNWPREDRPEAAEMDSLTLLAVDSLMRSGIEIQAFPGAAVALGRRGVIAKMEGFGHFTYEGGPQVTPQSIFDMASLTKVIATTTAAMLLYEQGALDLDAPVSRYLEAFRKEGFRDITIRHLLTHSAGFIPFRPFHQMGVTTRQQVIDSIMAEPLIYKPGSQSKYSDFSMITLYLVIEKITGQDFASWAKTHIFDPLRMDHTGFRPGNPHDTSIVPTERDRTFRRRLLQGEVHDETAYLLGGVSGHAGLFSTAEDLTHLAFMYLQEGRIGGHTFLKPETIALFTRRVSDDPENTRALGWDTRSLSGPSSAGVLFGPRSFGHTGYTGTSIWIDPDADLFVILLTNRVYPTRENSKLFPIRGRLADIVWKSAAGASVEPVLQQGRRAKVRP